MPLKKEAGRKGKSVEEQSAFFKFAVAIFVFEEFYATASNFEIPVHAAGIIVPFANLQFSIGSEINCDCVNDLRFARDEVNGDPGFGVKCF